MMNLDWKATAAKAKNMTDSELFYARLDCIEAAKAADELEKAGCAVSKTGGYYMDEASVYRDEMNRR